MQRKSLLVILVAAVITSVVVATIATSGTTNTWEKTFDVSKPEIQCEIKISNYRAVGYPVRIWVFLKMGNESGEFRWHEWINHWEGEHNDGEDEDRRYCWRERYNHWVHILDDCKNRSEFLKDTYNINGTYSAQLYWWNETSEEWQHVMYLQEETNITITCFSYIETYTFIPDNEGEYKVEITFETDSETYNFTNEN